MQLKQQLVQKLQMKLKFQLTPKMIQQFRTFQLSVTDLQKDLKEKSEKNEFLKLKKPDQLLTGATDISEYAADTSKPDLYSHLLTQLEMMRLNKKDFEIAETIIRHLNDRGWIEDYPTLKKELNCADRKAGDILKIVQTLEPDGIGARSLKESLLIQLSAYAVEDTELDEILKLIIQTHLDDLASKSYEKIADKLDITTQDVIDAHQFIRENLSPTPASAFSNSTAVNITPSFQITIENNEPKIQCWNAVSLKKFRYPT